MLSYTILDDFIEESVSPTEKAILALTFIGAIVGVVGIFWTLLIPAAVVEEIEEVAAEIGEEIEEAVVGSTAVAEAEAEGLGTAAINRLGEGLTSPKAAPGQGAAIYGSIPGALITGSASTWSKIVANDA